MYEAFSDFSICRLKVKTTNRARTSVVLKARLACSWVSFLGVDSDTAKCTFPISLRSWYFFGEGKW